MFLISNIRKYFKKRKLEKQFHADIAFDILQSCIRHEVIQQTPLPPYNSGTLKVDKEIREAEIELQRKKFRVEKQVAICEGIAETAQNFTKRFADYNKKLEELNT